MPVAEEEEELDKVAAGEGQGGMVGRIPGTAVEEDKALLPCGANIGRGLRLGSHDASYPMVLEDIGHAGHAAFSKGACEVVARTAIWAVFGGSSCPEDAAAAAYRGRNIDRSSRYLIEQTRWKDISVKVFNFHEPETFQSSPLRWS